MTAFWLLWFSRMIYFVADCFVPIWWDWA